MSARGSSAAKAASTEARLAAVSGDTTSSSKRRSCCCWATNRVLRVVLRAALEMILSRMPPDTEASQPYSHEGDEVGLVISGQMELWVGDRHFLLTAGDSFSHSSREPHRYRNPGPGETVVIWAISPPTY